jgi:hypothetical protein
MFSGASEFRQPHRFNFGRIDDGQSTVTLGHEPLTTVIFDYDQPAKFVLDKLRFSYRGDVFKGSGFLEWNPAKGFQIDALLDKTFAPMDTLRMTGQIFIETKGDTFPIWLHVRNHLTQALNP